MQEKQKPEPIAIVGSGCRFPGSATNPSKLWDLLQNPRDVCSEIPTERFNTTGHYHHDGTTHGLTNVRHSYLMNEDIRAFDAGFFNISPNEADSMDPQQRILLETVYEAIEAGGHPLEALKGSDTAVYVGTMGVDYNDTLLRDVNTIPTYFATGTNRAIISNRISYFFDWHGPSMTIDTACSSSLIAVHQGVQALRSGETRVAVACGTQIILGPEVFIFESKMRMLSPTGRSRMWDADADGYARGEGVAAIVLKRLSDAIADGDHIECIIRETGANQDGYSNGITVPSTDAQAALIRKTYARAGLDLSDARDHPQFFEAHGTGTQAGDPKEAAAIAQCFGAQRQDTTPLYVGSVKTVIGHTEGAAGLAGLFKGLKSIQHGHIAPNLLFNSLNPKIKPFISGLKVPTELTPWPSLPEGVPRRVSVNSFGFGGSNAHAILEEYRPAPLNRDTNLDSPNSIPFTPFVFSAVSEASLIDQLKAHSEYLKSSLDVDLSDLAWTLQSRRSQFPYKAAFSASTTTELAARLDEAIAQAAQKPIGFRAKHNEDHILGVFTGQGAQWPAMGAELIKSSDFASRRLQELEESLATLPEGDRPDWSLREQLLAGAESSRIAEAKLSQPLCTAVQVVLVDLLREAGITFKAVVGHSSGEIGAAYAAGFLTGHDAIRVAYYRGLYAKLAGNPLTQQKGAMMAVGTSLEDAQDLINLKAFRGRVTVAAENSSASVTLSGDEDALAHAKKVFDEEKKFARMLKVDTAYHSHHMLPCSDTYVDALRRNGIKIDHNRDTRCSWFSSVSPGAAPMEPNDELTGLYWRDNMVNSVLFADAVKNAVAAEPLLNFVLEIGPHPALQGPTLQTVADLRPAPLPYSGVLSRGKSDIESFAKALGNAWTYLTAGAVDFERFDRAVSPRTSPRKLVVGLPSYQWNHARSSLYESRKSRNVRGRKTAFHEILGVESPDCTTQDKRWSNVLKVSEIPWLEGHQLQGQVVFPAAGYCALAIEASRTLSQDKAIETIDLRNLTIPRAITFEEDTSSGVETLVTLTSIVEEKLSNTATAEFSCYSCPADGAEHSLDLMASCSIQVTFADSSNIVEQSSTRVQDSMLTGVEVDRFYDSLGKLGYGYSGPFRTLSELKRKFNQSSGFVDSYAYDDLDETVYLVHPTWLDVAFQASMLAYSAPGDERLWSLHVPTSITSLRVSPALCGLLPFSSASKLPVYSTLADGEAFSASIDIYNDASSPPMVQVDGLKIQPFAPATAADDRRLFSTTKWSFAGPNGNDVVKGVQPSSHEVTLASVCERVSFYYIRKWDSEIAEEDWAKGQEHHAALREYIRHMLSLAAKDQHPTFLRQWSEDSASDIKELIEQYPGDVDLNLLVAVGENIPAAVRGDTTILEHMLPNNMLDDYYKYGLGFARYNSFLAGMMEHIVHRYPHAKIFEIGAGTGGATKYVLDRIGSTYSSYTYTDVSVGFFEKAAQLFRAHSDRMIFKTFDAEKSPMSQGFEKGTHDVVIASNVLHATHSLQKTLEHTRQLLKPGGYLLLLELTNNAPTRFSNIMGGLSGWWAGVGDSPPRQYAPTITPSEWQTALRKAGFTGIEAITPEIDGITWPFSIMAAQAADDAVTFLRRPLSSRKSAADFVYIDNLVILGNKTLLTSQVAEELEDHLGPFCNQVSVLSGLPSEADALSINPMSTFINLVDLDTPVFKDITAETMDGLRRLYGLANHITWVTAGAFSGNEPYHMSSVAFSRAMSHENGHISMNHLDIATGLESASKAIAEHVLRQVALDGLAGQGLLWSREPEMLLENGQWQVARLVDNIDQNARLNSSRRAIRRTVSKSAPKLSVSATASGELSLVEQVNSIISRSVQQDNVVVEASSLRPLLVAGSSHLYLSAGKIAGTNDAVIALSLDNAREISPIAVTTASPAEESLLIAAAGELIADRIVKSIPSASNVLIQCSHPDRFLIDALSRASVGKRITLSCIYDAKSATKAEAADWLAWDSRTSAHVVRKRLQARKLTHYIDLSDGLNDLAEMLSETLGAGVRRVSYNDSLSNVSSVHADDMEIIQAALDTAVSRAVDVQVSDFEDQLTDLDHVSGLTATKSAATKIVRWSGEGDVVVDVRPLSGQSMFSKDKSYVLLGLAGEVGRSLTEWMVANGAGCVCLASRSPKVDQAWLDSFHDSGATVKVFRADATSKESLKNLIQEIRATLPPIAGIANGAMVLEDTLFSKMSVDTMRKVLGPKIDGSRYLDEIFHDDDLDFFVLFSSSACIIGNSGQSNYAAANGFLNGLSRQRRQRGLACSVVDIGRVSGLGYVETAGIAVINQLDRFGLMPISEAEFRQMFAETILAGYKDRKTGEFTSDPVVTTGIRKIRDDEDIQGPWFENPLFSHCIVETKTVVSDDSKSSNKKLSLPVATQLAACTSREEAQQVLQECFINKLRIVLQLADATIEADVPLVEIGIDSLIAVEVRSWFLKEVKVDIPVLKIVGGASPAELCDMAMKKVSDEMLSGLGSGGKPIKPAPTATTNKAADPAQVENLISKASARLAVPVPLLSTNSSSSVSTISSITSEVASGPASERSGAVTPPTPTSLDSVSDTDLPPLAKTSAVQEAPPKLDIIKSAPLSFGQSRFWFLRMLLEDQTTSNVSFFYHIAGSLRIADLERAVRTVAARHESLRTAFVPDPVEVDQATQNVLRRSSLRLEHVKVDSMEQVQEEYHKVQQTVFDLETGDLFRLVLCTLSPTSSYLLVNYHHILMDGVSFQIFLSDLEKAYMGKSLGKPPGQYLEHSERQRQAYESGEMQAELEYWRAIFPPHEEPPVLPLLPMAKTATRTTVKEFGVHQVGIHLSPELAAQVKQISRTNRSTPMHFYLAAFKAMLFRLTDARDLTIGIADANRQNADVMGSIGFFLNLLTLRFQRQDHQKFSDAIAEARTTTYSALENARLPFDVLLQELSVPRSSAHSPLFQAFFDYRQGAQEKHPWGNVQFEFQEVHPGGTNYDITLDVTESGNDALVMIRVQKALYDEFAAKLLLETFVHLVDVLSRETSLELNDVPLWSNEQLQKAVEVGRGPELLSDWPSTLPHRIDQMAQAHPSRKALVDGIGPDLTYSEMTSRIESIAEALHNAGAAPGMPVLVFQTASSQWICSMLAIMRIGAIYVPLDLRYPLERLAEIANDCQPVAILVDAANEKNVPQLGQPNAQVVNIARVGAVPPSASVANFSQADAPAAILYTSGSTGKSKGIVVTHDGLRNEIEGYTKQWNLGAETTLQQSAYTFNHSSDQIYTGLVNGGTVVTVPWDKRGDPIEVTKILRDNGITYTKATPSEYSLWIQYGSDNLSTAKDWTRAFGGGETLTATHLSEIASLDLPQLRFFNSYGPTEISISCTKMEIDYRKTRSVEEGTIPCGFPLPNYNKYIVDNNLNPVPIGVPGELCISGPGVSLGYLNNEELTSKSFVDNHFATDADKARGWTRLYRTGDLFHLQEDGAAVFHSRIEGDSQVKIRGLRIELADIEQNLIATAQGALKEAVVLLRPGDPDYLAAFVVFSPRHATDLDKDAFLAQLLRRLPLPQYMIPAVAFPLDKFPLNNHSKVDRKLLKTMPLPERALTKPSVNQEWTPALERLRTVWQDVLGNKDLGLDIDASTSFFSVGGNSLLAIRLQSRIRKAYDVTLRLIDILEASTLGEMARKIEESSSVSLIDWEEETAVPAIPDFLNSVKTGPSSVAAGKTIVITGATGFLGRRIVPQLAENPDIAAIHCIAVRDTSGRKQPLGEKVITHAGDLSHPLLGLTEDEFKTLASTADIILHLGAVRSFWDNYHTLRSFNVHPTKELVKMAAPRQVPIHYISSSGVLPAEIDGVAGSAGKYVPDTNGAEGYTATRWASERILERSHESLNVPISITRYLPASQPLSSPEQLEEFVRWVDETGVLPDMEGWTGRFDMMPAEQAGNMLLRQVLGANHERGACYFAHVESPISVEIAEMRDYLEEKRGTRGLERMPGLKWIGRIKAQGWPYLLTTQQAFVGGHESRR
ncbi:hypothetical protein PRZ48_008233 [Zasmidium cellare]|uniref:Polyketide synthase n=1 Tax=Zasmidium cellare TaxID=395010 RepID=A0ABR0EEZ4_ZASCE|nr:hypothetical protein PRZ48_008233 [Zasmidium cellare]